MDGWIGTGRTVELLHVLASGVIAGGQLLMSAAAWRPLSGETAPGLDALVRLERWYRRFALAAILVGVAFGAWFLDYTLVSRLLLVSTPYGPLLGTKVLLTLAFVLYLIVAPPLLVDAPGAGTASRWRRRLWALAGAALVTLLTALGLSLQYA